MIRGYTAQQVRDAEAPHLATGEPLMQRAAHGLAGRILDQLAERRRLSAPTDSDGRVLLVVGSGDNGGDALFAGAELAEAGIEVVVLGVGSRMHEAGRAAAATAGARFVSPVPFEPDPAALAALARDAIEFDVIVDGIVGTGTTTGSSGSPALRGTARAVVEALLPALSSGSEGAEGPGGSGVPGGSGGFEGPEGPDIVAVDIPSGIDPDTGAAPDPAVLPATVTVTFGGIKAGLLRGDGAELAGRVILVEIGIEDDLAAVTPAIELPAVKLT